MNESLAKEWENVIKYAQQLGYGEICIELKNGIPKLIKKSVELPYTSIKVD